MKHRIEDFSHDLATPDGMIESIRPISDRSAEAVVAISNISPWFVGFDIDPALVFFNGKSVLAQSGINIVGTAYELNKAQGTARVAVKLEALGPVGKELLSLIDAGLWVGKLFAKDDRRRVRDPDYITRMFGRSDRWGSPLLSLGSPQGGPSLNLERVDGRAVAYLPLLNGRIAYNPSVFGFLPTLAKATAPQYKIREILRLHQAWTEGAPKIVSPKELLLVKTSPLHIRTVFAHVVDELLPAGYIHTSASVLQPDTEASGDVYELYGEPTQEISAVPLEFYTLEPYRENIFFSDRDQLQASLEEPKKLKQSFETAPKPENHRASVYIVQGHQLEQLRPEDWIAREPFSHELPGIGHELRQAMIVEKEIVQQPSYPFLKAIENGTITSQGILLTRFFPSPILKRMLLSEPVARCVKGIYFQHPSQSHGDFFSSEDRSFLNDLHKIGMPVFWVDEPSNQILQYLQKSHRATGMFVPLHQIDKYLKATVFGVYGSNLVVGPFEEQLSHLLKGVLSMRQRMHHPLLSHETPLALVTGGGPRAMEIANKTAMDLGILSCANIADFRLKAGAAVVNEQKQNPYVEAKMTYRLQELVERQAEFNLDFPIFVTGGIGTDFEMYLEEVRRKVGCVPPNPILLFGDVEYWRSKLTSRFQCNMAQGTIKGSEWVSGCFFCIQTAEQGLEIYRRFFEGTLPLGKAAKPQPLGFVTDVNAVY